MKWNNGSNVKPPSAKRQEATGHGSATGELRGFGMGLGRDEDGGEAVENIDFKMVTFSLAGKDYGIDIMRVKEIAKFGGFTYVPNTRPFVTGVYNLRGEIISVIDLRLMFNLPEESREESGTQDGLILRLQSGLIGVVVDRIDRVIGISSETIQPPHPIFADVKIDYISGVVEHEDRLYIILDAERVFGRDGRASGTQPRAEPTSTVAQPLPVPDPLQSLEPTQMQHQPETPQDGAAAEPPQGTDDAEFGFVVDGLATFGKLHYSAVNRDWMRERYAQWRAERLSAGRQVQFGDEQEADAFVQPFFSPCTGRLWDPGYAEAVSSIVPAFETTVINAWNPGCGKGYESYALAALLSEAYRGKRIKLFAGDNDLLSISTAPSLLFSPSDIPAYLQPFTTETRNGIGIADELKNSILFEYHDVLHESDVPGVHVVLCRDLVSLLAPDEQERLLTKFFDVLIPGGILIIGSNERLDHDGRWEPVAAELSAYRKV